MCRKSTVCFVFRLLLNCVPLAVVALLFSGCVSPLSPAISSGNTKEVSRLLDAGTDVNAKLLYDEFGNPLNLSPVQFAAARGQTDVLKLLLEKGAQPVNPRGNVKGDILLTAAMNGRTETVRWILDQMADINGKDGNGCTALILGAYNGHPACVSLLLSRGADAGLTDNSGKNAYQYAWERGDSSMADAIINAGNIQTALALKGLSFERLLNADEQRLCFFGGWTDSLIEAKNSQLPGLIAHSTVEQRIALLNTVEKKLTRYQTQLATLNSAAEDAVRKGQNAMEYRKNSARVQALISVLLEIKNMLMQS